ncbi:uncharacterized protein LOC144504724 [Mustelus asterias]
MMHEATCEADDLLVEVEELKVQLDKNSNDERILVQRVNAEKYRVILEKEELISQLEKMKEREKSKMIELENEKGCIQLELEDTKTELEKLRETQNENLIELRREKDALLIEIEELRKFLDKMKAKNNLLLERIESFQKEQDLKSQASFYTPTMTTSTEMLMIAHQIKPHNTIGLNEDCFFGGSATTSNESAGQHSATANSKVDAATEYNEEINKVKEMLKQLKRERKLLLDVMMIMYTRRWFVEEAIPYIKRALKKCGIKSDDMD